MSVTDFIVSLDGYEGPLDLLLSLAKTQKVDLKKISILELAKQYLGFIDKIKDNNIEIAADYLIMAAWLALIKSKLLLPEDEDNPIIGEITENLASQIERLNSVRELGGKLTSRDRLGSDFFSIGNNKDSDREVKTHYQASLIDILNTYFHLSTKNEFSPFKADKVDIISIDAAIDNLKEYLSLKVHWITLDDVIKYSSIRSEKNVKSALAATFSASLELAKRGEIIMDQVDTFDTITLKANK